MTARTKVYGSLLLLSLLGGGYFGNKKFNWFPIKKAQADVKQKGKDEKKKDAGAEPTPVELAAVARGEISSYISATANLRALRDVAVATQADGIVREVLAEEGDFVKEGQVLCRLDEEPLKIRLDLATQRLAQAKAQLASAKLRLDKIILQVEHSRRQHDRFEKALKEGLASAQETDTRKLTLEEQLSEQRITSSQIQELVHRVGELEAEIAQVNLDLGRTQIRAAFSGYITRRTVELGQRVRALESLFQIGSFSPLFADVYLSESEARQVRPNQAATVRLGVDNAVRAGARVERIGLVVDEGTGTVKVTVQLQQSEAGFRPGAFVRVEIRTDTRHDTVLIPKRALIEEDGENFVYVAKGDTARRTKVSLGFESEGRVEIRSGLDAGQQIVVAGQGALKEGAKIKPTRS